MKTFARIAVAAAVIAGAWTAPASAQQTRELAQSGPWVARMAVSDRNVPLCVMSNVSGETGLHIKYFQGSQNLVVHLFRAGWQMPRDARVSMTLEIDRLERWNADVTSMGDGVEFTVGQAEMTRFEAALRRGQFMNIQLGSGNKSVPMQIALGGVNDVAESFIQCMRAINGRGGAQGAGAPAPQQQPRPVQVPRNQPRELDA